MPHYPTNPASSYGDNQQAVVDAPPPLVKDPSAPTNPSPMAGAQRQRHTPPLVKDPSAPTNVAPPERGPNEKAFPEDTVAHASETSSAKVPEQAA